LRAGRPGPGRPALVVLALRLATPAGCPGRPAGPGPGVTSHRPGGRPGPPRKEAPPMSIMDEARGRGRREDEAKAAARPSRDGDGHSPDSSDCPDAPEWREPIPLDTTPEAPAWPMAVWPASLRPFADDVSQALNAPTDYVCLPMLVIAGGAIGASRALE